MAPVWRVTSEPVPELEERKRDSTIVTPSVDALRLTPGKTALADLDPDAQLDDDVVDDALADDGITIEDSPDAKTRKRDRATIEGAEQRLVAQIENEKMAVPQRKAALRDLLCTQRGIDYARLPAGDATRTAIDK